MTRRQVLEGALVGPAVLGGTLAASPAGAAKVAPRRTQMKVDTSKGTRTRCCGRWRRLA
jgi:hypothetical protein